MDLQTLLSEVAHLETKVDMMRKRKAELEEMKHREFYLHTIIEELARLWPRSILNNQTYDSPVRKYFKVDAPRIRKEIANSKWRSPVNR